MIILIDKPKGITSFDVIRRLRITRGIRKMGHAGTLDPMATGLMIIATDSDTKKLSGFLGLPKTYEAEVTLGIRTDTSDMDGKMVEEKTIPPDVTTERVRGVLGSLVGDVDLPVSVYSALKRAGKPLYEYAREGKEVEAPIRTMHVDSVLFGGFDGLKIKATFAVGSGTYIRSLAEEVGKRLGTVATLSALRRTVVGDFKVEDAEVLT
jgi:tRNA pseudouridine55 synthase